jgi:hypothetical protein
MTDPSLAVARYPNLGAPTQVNAKRLLREVHAAEEGLEAGVTSRISWTVLRSSGGKGRACPCDR